MSETLAHEIQEDLHSVRNASLGRIYFTHSLGCIPIGMQPKIIRKSKY